MPERGTKVWSFQAGRLNHCTRLLSPRDTNPRSLQSDRFIFFSLVLQTPPLRHTMDSIQSQYILLVETLSKRYFNAVQGWPSIESAFSKLFSVYCFLLLSGVFSCLRLRWAESLQNQYMSFINTDAECSQANRWRWPNVVIVLFHRLRRWPDTKTTLGQRIFVAEFYSNTNPRTHEIFHQCRLNIGA